MANNYLQFSMSVPLKTEGEREWCSASLAALDKFLGRTESGSQEFASDIAAVVMEGLRKDWSHQGFEWSIAPTPDQADQVAELWLHADEAGEPEQVASFLRAYLAKFNPTGSLWFSWAYTCSKMRVNEFGGGAIVVTANRVTFLDVQDWATRRAKTAGKRLAAR
jgi:hypothetical protein